MVEMIDVTMEAIAASALRLKEANLKLEKALKETDRVRKKDLESANDASLLILRQLERVLAGESVPLSRLFAIHHLILRLTDKILLLVLDAYPRPPSKLS